MEYIQNLEEKIKISKSYSELLNRCGYAINGTNIKRIKELLILKKIDTSHFRPISANRVKSRKIEEYLKIWTNESPRVGSHHLKKRLIKEKILQDICNRCGIFEWEGEKLSLHLDHINGIRNDNRLENLRLLCPNCHSLTETYAGKKLKKDFKNYCMDCKKDISPYGLRCKSCNAKREVKDKRNKINWPLAEEVVEMLKNNSYKE